MDQFWQAAANFMNSNGLAGRAAVAPVEFAELFPIESGYANVAAADAERIDALVLHKGRYRELDRHFTRAAIARLHPSFANEVFIVLTANCAVLDGTNPHVGHMQAIRLWASSEDSIAPQSESGKRMPAAYVGRGQILAETAFGHLMILAAADRSITPHIIRDGYFDRGLTHFIQRSLRPGMVYVDVGANMGVYAVLAASCVGEGGRVVAIEAIPRLAEMVSDNLAMNGFLARSRVLPFAAANQNCEMTIYEFDRIQGHNTLLPEVAKIGEDTYLDKPKPLTVQAKRLSDLLAKTAVERPNLIKIDVEGYELEVLKGARDFLAAGKRPDLILEWHPEFMIRSGAPEELYATLAKDLGYSIHRIGPDGQTRPIEFLELMSLEHSDIVAQVE
jgi:FkbM family methyltransferase